MSFTPFAAQPKPSTGGGGGSGTPGQDGQDGQDGSGVVVVPADWVVADGVPAGTAPGSRVLRRRV